MNKFMKKAVNENNEGFSLVELIIVIAIMAILVGVIALQVIPYMEKSRVGKDQQTIDSVYSAFNTSLADESISGDLKATIKAGDDAADLATALPDAVAESMWAALGAKDDTDLANGTTNKLVSAKAKGNDIICEYNDDTKEVTVYSVGDPTIYSSNKGEPKLVPTT